ncbi:hypothetical protein EDC19_0211 [Natranaerovirga hydrolytica]|uniref:Uncharacterized protein n=1 Tax=Natranaerovirga hydrolytica TaxID=680378 RepID=A0A4R1N4D9_9FIRM|nr:hypothetical protein [Natranaerovirga hydrolytica]TCK97809.1 hypothetical protein EDC19_0211 [Natranaerovirga hydrolytica]
MENEQLFKMMELMYSEFKEVRSDVTGLKNDFAGLKSDVTGLKNDFSELKSDVTGLKNDFSELKSDVTGLKNDIKAVDHKVNKTNLMIENDIKPKIHALFDGYTQNTKDIKELNTKVDTLQHSVNNLEIKAAVNDNKLIDLSKGIQ